MTYGILLHKNMYYCTYDNDLMIIDLALRSCAHLAFSEVNGDNRLNRAIIPIRLLGKELTPEYILTNPACFIDLTWASLKINEGCGLN